MNTLSEWASHLNWFWLGVLTWLAIRTAISFAKWCREVRDDVRQRKRKADWDAKNGGPEP